MAANQTLLRSGAANAIRVGGDGQEEDIEELYQKNPTLHAGMAATDYDDIETIGKAHGI